MLFRSEISSAESGQASNQIPDNIVATQLNWVPVVGPADKDAAVVQAFTAVPSFPTAIRTGTISSFQVVIIPRS